ncbi:MAG TPA: iron ABC transporter permease [Planctomycetaceae bacterium]|nr:iron ABC transporter permease [Planctomycetaceae bacterium]
MPNFGQYAATVGAGVRIVVERKLSRFECVMNPGRRAVWPVLCWTFTTLLSVPLLSILWSVTKDSEGVWQHLSETVLGDYIANTLVLAVGVGSGTALIGVSTAWIVTNCRFPLSRIFRWALLLPLAIPTYLSAYALTDLFQFSGPAQTWFRELSGCERGDYWFPEVRSLPGAITILTFGLYPYVYLAASTGFSSQSASVTEASRTLGTGSWARFFRLALPLARPAIFAGLVLVVMETLAEFGAVDYCAVDTFSTGIYRTWISRGSHTAASQLSACLVGIAGFVFLSEMMSRQSARFHHSTQRTRMAEPVVLGNARGCFATIFCLAPICIGFLLPVGRFIVLTISGGDSRATELLAGLVTNSLLVASLAVIVTVFSGLVLACIRRATRSRATRTAVQVAGMGYAIPGSVIAIGALGPIWYLEGRVLEFTEQFTNSDPGLFLSGTLVAVLLGYLVRFLAVPLNVIGAGFARIPPAMDSSARTLGSSRIGVLARVHLPLLRGSLVSAALLVFVDVLKELPATLILRPFDFDTLAVRVYHLASDERLAEASTPALAIVVAGLIPVVLLTRMMDDHRTATGSASATGRRQ